MELLASQEGLCKWNESIGCFVGEISIVYQLKITFLMSRDYCHHEIGVSFDFNLPCVMIFL